MVNGHRYVLKPQVVVDGDPDSEAIVMIDGRSGVMCACNGTAAALLRLLGDGASADQLVTSLCADFDVAANDAERDVRDFLARLGGMGIVEDAR